MVGFCCFLWPEATAVEVACIDSPEANFDAKSPAKETLFFTDSGSAAPTNVLTLLISSKF
jgi:hypothetical protein